MADAPPNPRIHVVEPGDDIAKIAHEKGADPEAIWAHPQNADLKKRRKNGEILLPGDRVFVPEKSPDALPAKHKAENHYEVTTIPSEVKVHVTFDDKPLPAGRAYEIVIDDVSRGTLKTKDGGLVQFYVEPDVTQVTLRFENPSFACDLLVGHLDPLDEPGGIAQRLHNLGYACPLAAPALPAGSKAEKDAREKHARLVANALRRFQEDAGLPPTGVADDATRAALADRTAEGAS